MVRTPPAVVHVEVGSGEAVHVLIAAMHKGFEVLPSTYGSQFHRARGSRPQGSGAQDLEQLQMSDVDAASKQGIHSWKTLPAGAVPISAAHRATLRVVGAGRQNSV
jgi:hypothetical protein